MRRATLIMLAWNRWALTRRSLDSLLATDLDEADVILVDNGSSDETPDAIDAYRSRVRYLRLPENLGFVRGMNAGIDAAGADDDVVLLNNDLVFTQRDWLGRMRDAAYSAPDVGIAGCRLRGPVPHRELYHSGGFIEPDALWGQQNESGVVEQDIAQFDRTRRVQGIAFALVYLRRDCLHRIGPLDSAYHSYFDDTDYCLRARAAGIATVVAGDVTLRHDQHGSTQDDGGFREKLWNASKATFAARWRETLREDYRGTVLWQGFTRHPSAHALLARTLVRRLDARGLRMAFAPLADELPDPEDFRLDLATRRRWDLSPDAAIVAAPAPRFVRARGRYRVGFTFGEWDRVPDDWALAARTLDRLIVPDEFQADAFRRVAPHVSIGVVPIGVDGDYFHPRVPAPRHPQGRFVFVAAVESLARDAPDRLVTAFRRTFRADEPVELLIHVHPGRDSAAIAHALAALVEDDGPRVRRLSDWTFPDYQRAQLLAAGDAYVSARRGGGWDPYAAAALACARPLIAPDFGSQAALVRAFGHPVAIARLVEDPSHPGSRWAEPDADALAARMREVFEHRERRRDDVEREAAAFAAAHPLDATAAALVAEIAAGGTLAPPRAQPIPHRPAALMRPASGQIVVLGMHRSGTSSVAGLLARLGAWPGDELLAGPDNPKGHYESAPLHGACVARLEAAGGDWTEPPRNAPAAAIDRFRRDAAAAIERLEPRRPWLIKEPRLCLLVRELLPLLTRPVFVIVVRDPGAVADSLAARDGIDRARAFALWEHYTRDAFEQSRGWPRVVVDYDALVDDPLASARRLHDALVALGVEGLRMPEAATVVDWIEPALRRQIAAGDAHAAMTDSQRALLAAIRDGSILDDADADAAAPLRAAG